MHEPYKLTLWLRLQKLSVADFEIAMKFLPAKIGIARSTFRRYIYMKQSCENFVPAEAILVFAQFFGCNPQDMFTDPKEFEQVQQEWEEFKAQAQENKLLFHV